MERTTLRPLTRRRLLASLTLPSLTGALLGGCQRASGGKTPVRFWNGFTGPDGRTMLRLVKRFNQENPDVQVMMQRMDWNTCYNKLFVAGLGGRAPEVFVSHTRALERFARAGFLRANDDLVEGANGLEVSDLDANVWEGVAYQGKHYGLPLDVHAMGMYYNQALFKEAGITDAAGNPRPPTTREEFLDTLSRITKPGKGNAPPQWGFVFTNWESNTYTFLKQFGGEVFTPGQDRCILHNDANIQALQFCVDLIYKHKVAPQPENFDAWIGFRQGKVGLVYEGIYMLADLQKQKDLPFGGAPVAQVGSVNAVWADSHNLCLRSDLEGKTLEATWRFVKYLSDNSLDWAEGGQIPVRKSLRAQPRFQAMEVQAAFARQIPIVRYMPRLPFIFEFQTEYNLAIEQALRNRATPAEALKGAEERINRVVARYNRDNLRGKGTV